MAIKKNYIFILLFIIILLSIISAQENQEANQETIKSNPYDATVRISILEPIGRMGFCTGSIIKINENTGIATILSAGHCMKNGHNDQYLIDYGPGTPQVKGQYLGHELDGGGTLGTKDIGLLTVPIDLNDRPKIVNLVEQSYLEKAGDNIYHVGHPGGEEISVVGSKVTSSVRNIGNGLFSELNFPPRGGRSGGGIFIPNEGTEIIYKRGKLFGIMTHHDPMRQTGIFSNPTQIFGFLNRIGFNFN